MREFVNASDDATKIELPELKNWSKTMAMDVCVS